MSLDESSLATSQDGDDMLASRLSNNLDMNANEENEEADKDRIVDEDKIGELILLGYNGSSESSRNGRRHRSKMILRRRADGNGVKKAHVTSIATPAHDAPAVQDASRHCVSYSYSRHNTVLVEYAPDPSKDMFQIGRSSEEQIDFTIVDTWLAAGSNMVLSPGNNAALHRQSVRSSSVERGGCVPGDVPRPISSTISRYACRILVDRDNLAKARIYAAGFDSSKNIALGEKATKWTKKNGDVDGLTTNGILILHPDRDETNEEDDSHRPLYVWREVSVDGDIFTLRETRSSTKRGEFVASESNMLQDGTLIDLCGATLLYRTAEGLARSPTRLELERSLDRLNAGKPQCPVNLNTLIIPKKRSARTQASSRQPYVYLRCGHVQGKHEWGRLMGVGNAASSYKCPICLVASDRVLPLSMGMESAFHLESNTLDYAFNPCGHVASLATVRYWSRIPLPHGTNSFHPVCPFCTSLLHLDKPYVRLIFQDHCFEN